MLFDTHMHCNYSCDSEMNFQQAIAAAAKQNIGMIVTEHWDYDYPTNGLCFLFDVEEYFSKLWPLRNDKVLVGIEIGMQTTTAERDEKLAAGYNFDFVLASIHCIGHRDLYEPACYEGYTRQQIVDEFLQDSITCLEQHDNFDAFAHIDYICRYWPYEGEEAHLRLQDNPEQFDKLFRLLITKNKPLEINTRRLDDPKAAAALLPLYRRYHELGGKYCTLGSDAHYEEHVGRRLQEALAIAKAADLQPVYFRNRQMKIMDID